MGSSPPSPLGLGGWVVVVVVVGWGVLVVRATHVEKLLLDLHHKNFHSTLSTKQ